MYPKVSIIWLNYNSINFLNLVLISLRSVFNLDYEKDSILKNQEVYRDKKTK